jgi:hypothetical protein
MKIWDRRTKTSVIMDPDDRVAQRIDRDGLEDDLHAAELCHPLQVS